jgi:hypothetical protein
MGVGRERAPERLRFRNFTAFFKLLSFKFKLVLSSGAGIGIIGTIPHLPDCGEIGSLREVGRVEDDA